MTTAVGQSLYTYIYFVYMYSPADTLYQELR